MAHAAPCPDFVRPPGPRISKPPTAALLSKSIHPTTEVKTWAEALWVYELGPVSLLLPVLARTDTRTLPNHALLRAEMERNNNNHHMLFSTSTQHMKPQPGTVNPAPRPIAAS